MSKHLKAIVMAAMATITSIAGAQTTIGTGASAQSGVAVGKNAVQADVTGDVFGTGVPVNYTGGMAFGNGAFAAGKNIALGDGLQAIQDGVPGSYSLVIGGLNYSNGQVEYRRVVGMANGLFPTDGANLGQVWGARDHAVSTANAYTDSSLSGVNAALANHDARITTAQTTADTAMTTAQGADTKATTALSQAGQALAIAQQTQQEVVQLTGRVNAIDSRVRALEDRVNGFDRRINGGVAMASAMNAAIAPSLAPGESAVVGGLGGFKGQGALALGLVHTNLAGQTFTAKFSTSSVGTAVAVGGAIKF